MLRLLGHVIGLKHRYDPQFARVRMNETSVREQYLRALHLQCKERMEPLSFEVMREMAEHMARMNIFEPQQKLQ